ncbi:MAG: DUF177 domain-containing protein [Deltaproteobacteria bacterium]|nr:DUF177 domain-containing protein [Deltaproteobacteria bacterium]
MREENPMIVHLREIPRDGLRLEFDLSGDFAREALVETEAEADSARLHAEAELEKILPNVSLRGHLRGEVTIPCSRCTAPARLDIDVPLRMIFVPRGEGEGEATPGEPEIEGEPAEEDLDLATYSNDRLDLGQVLREQLLLQLPIAHLCRDDCKGLCPQCGKDLNEGPCGCPPASKDERWAALRQVKL